MPKRKQQKPRTRTRTKINQRPEHVKKLLKIRQKADRVKKHYYLVLDVETAGSFDKPLVYDLGGVITDRQGKIHSHFSFIIEEIFSDKKTMATAYYRDKIPLYLQGLQKRTYTVKRFMDAHAYVMGLIAHYNVKAIMAYNASFDIGALNTTLRYIIGRKYFFPKGTEVNCIWHMACQTIGQQATFRKWTRKNGLVSEKGNIQTSAEVMYAYINLDPHFEERHMGIYDVIIETRILAHIFRQRKRMNRGINRTCWRLVQEKG